MKSFDTNLKKYAEKINLKVSERHELRERILSYMEYHPLPKKVLSRQELVEGLQSESFVVVQFKSMYLRIAGGVFALLIVAAPFFAERSIPGDALYLVKTGFNEPIQAQLANSPYEKIEFETKLMERRISEARLLASEGKLTEETKTQIAETIKSHTEAVQDGLTKLREQDKDGAAIAEIAFNSSLEVQSAVLGADGSASSTALESILMVVNDAHDQVVSNQEEGAPSFDGLMAQVELETSRVQELFSTIKRTATDEEVKDIERRISDINRLIQEAKDTLANKPDVAATNLATTLGLVQKLIVFMTDINVRDTVSLESIVPIVLSTEERIIQAKKEIEDIGILKMEIRGRLETVIDSGIAEKASEGITMLENFLLKADVALQATDIQSAEGAVREARALSTDLDALTHVVNVEEIPNLEEEVIINGTETGSTTASTTNTSSTTPVQESTTTKNIQ